MLLTNIYAENTFCYRDYESQVPKVQHMYIIRLILLFVLNTPGYMKFKSKVLKQINPNLGGLSRDWFATLFPNNITSFKTIPSFDSHTCLASCIYDFFD